jgi:hypothetical protein
MRTKLIAMILLLVLAAALFPPMAYAVTEADHGDDTVVYEEIKSAAEARRDELLYLLELELPSDILKKLEEALITMDEAEETVDTREATELYLYALKLFRNTWQRYLSYNPEATVESLEDIDEDDKPSPEESEPPKGLEKEIKETKEKRLIEIQEEILEKITVLGEHIEELKGYLSEGDSKVVEKALETELRKLEKIMDKVSEGEYDGAIDDLILAEFEIEDDVDEMDDKEAAKTLRMVESLLFQIQRTEEKRKRKAEEGEDTSEEDDTIDDVNEELDEVKKEFKDKADKEKQKDDRDKKDKKDKEDKEDKKDKKDKAKDK